MGAFVERTSTGRRLEPVGNVVLHGAGQCPEEFQAYCDLLSPNLPLLYMWYMGLMSPHIETRFEALARELDTYPASLIPQIGVSMTCDGDPSRCYDHRVAAGELDDRLEALCMGIASLGRPVFLRLGYEFSGEWNGYEPESFRAAWIRVWTALRRHGLDEAALVWCYAPDAELTADYRPFYPGDAYVDWWGIDLFSRRDFVSPKVRGFLDDAERAGYPVMIGEASARYEGVLRGDYSWDQWFRPFFDLIHARASIKAMCYISWNWGRYPQWADWGECRIGENPVVLERYREEMARPWYRHAVIGCAKERVAL